MITHIVIKSFGREFDTDTLVVFVRESDRAKRVHQPKQRYTVGHIPPDRLESTILPHERALSAMPVEFVEGDLFETSDLDAIAHGCNCRTNVCKGYIVRRV